MKKCILILFLAYSCVLVSQNRRREPGRPFTATNHVNNSDANTAHVVIRRSGDIALTSFSRYGLYPGWELNAQLLAEPFTPNIFIKKQWYKKGFWMAATRHGLMYQTPALNFAQKNFDSYLPDSIDVGHYLTMKNEILISRLFFDDCNCEDNDPYLILTANVGLETRLLDGGSELDSMDMRVLNHRAGAIKAGSMLSVGLQANGSLPLGLHFMISGSYYSSKDGNAIESAGRLRMYPLQNVSLGFGVNYVRQNLENFSDSYLLPAADIIISFGKIQGPRSGISRNKTYKRRRR